MITFVPFRQGWPCGRPGPEGGVDHSAQSAYDSARSFSGEATGTVALIVVDHRALLIRPLACFLAFRTPWPGASAWPLTSDQRPRPRVRVRVSAQAVRRGVRHQARARGGHHPAVDSSPSDTGNGRRRPVAAGRPAHRCSKHQQVKSLQSAT